MRRLLGVAALLFLMVMTWRIGNMLSSDAVSMAVGLIFGVLAGVPTALIILMAPRQQDDGGYEAGRQQGFRDSIDLAQGRRPELPMQTWHTVEYGSNGVRVEKTISIARPFGHLVDEQRQ